MNEVDLGAVALILLASIGIAYGIACTVLARKFADHGAIRAAGRRLVAHLMELRLFMEDPLLLLRSQRDLIAAYIALLRAFVVPGSSLIIVSVPLLFVLQNWFAKAPLPLHRPAIVTVHLQRMFDVTLTTPPEITIDTDAVRALASNEVSWRVTPIAAVNGRVLVKGASERIEHRIVAGKTFVGRLFGSRSPVEISYPRATIAGESWMTWFLVFSCAGSLLALILFRLIA